MRLGVLASHAGTILQAVIDAFKNGTIDGELRLVIGNNSSSGALKRAATEGIPTSHISAKTHPDFDERDRAIARTLHAFDCDWVLLAGYMKRLGPVTLSGFEHRLINTHPSLLPKYGGRGFYGLKVHEAVIAAADTVTGISIHYVSGDYDTGPLIAQTRIPVDPGDTAQTLEARVKTLEKTFIVETLRKLSRTARSASV